MRKKEHNYKVDLLRIIAISGVVLIHTTTKTLELAQGKIEELPWTFFLNQISRFAVPIFFIISGFLLESNSPAEINYATFLNNRLKRIFLPYVVWSAVYYYSVYKGHSESLVLALLKGTASYQLYFIPVLFIFYLIFPLLYKHYKKITDKRIIFILILIEIILSFYDYYIGAIKISEPFRTASLTYFYFLFGMIMANNIEKFTVFAKKWNYLLTGITATLALYIFIEGRSMYLNTGNYHSYYSQWRPSVLVYSLLIMILLYSFFNKLNPKNSLITILAKRSFFVFFVHIIVIEVLMHSFGYGFIKANPNLLHYLWFDPLFFFVVAALSFLLATITHKIPDLEKLTG